MGVRVGHEDFPNLLLAAASATNTPLLLADAIGPGRPIVWVNAAFETTSGFTAAQLLGRNASLMQGPGTSAATVRALREALDAGRPYRGRLLNYRPDGSPWWNDMHISPVRDTAGVLTHFIGVQHDVSDQVMVEDRAEHAATHDGLTGLVNRASFTAQLDRELGRSSRDRRAIAVLFLDVDGFKEINDTYGHAAGDELLVEIGQRLTGRLRDEDLIARLGGDEFLALVVDLTGDGAKAATRVVSDLAAALSRPFLIDATAHRVQVSIGVALYPRDGSTGAELIAAADAAMYLDKSRRDRPGSVSDPAGDQSGDPDRPLVADTNTGTAEQPAPATSIVVATPSSALSADELSGERGSAAGMGPARETAMIDAFLDLSHALTTEDDVSDMLARLVEGCVDLLGATAAGVLLLDPAGQLAVLAASSSRQHVLEAFQLQAAQGPCLDCTRTGNSVLVGDLAAEHATTDRWPQWSSRALSDGIRSAYAVPMRLRGNTVGALNLLGGHTEVVDAHSYRLVAALADVATLAVSTTRQIRGRDQQVVRLQDALTSRVLIEQAKGVIATTLGTTVNEAFEVLRAHARGTNRHLTDVSGDITTGRLAVGQLHGRGGSR